MEKPRPLRLSALLMAALGRLLPEGIGDPWIEEISADSRDSQEGRIFVALRGSHQDGHRFIEAALLTGCSAVIAQEGSAIPASAEKNPRIIRVPDTYPALAALAATLYGPLPSAIQGTVLGITGTNGKTTSTFLLEAILKAAGKNPGILGTINYRVGKETIPSPFTTPTPVLLWRLLRTIGLYGADSLVMEVSSHALAQYRVDGLAFDVVGFTNLTQDHLDFHRTFEAYREAKGRLFSDLVKAEGRAVLNADDPAFGYYRSISKAPVWSFSIRDPDADIAVKEAEMSVRGIRADLQTPAGILRLRSRLMGHYNLSNLLLAAGMALGLGLPIDVIEGALAELSAVPGRLESVESDLPFEVLVDYAHTPDALLQVLSCLRPLCKGRMITVFGCGGDRDPGKRPKMGQIATSLSEIAIVTSDNPRTEDPKAIVDQILAGVEEVALLSDHDLFSGKSGLWVEIDRRLAIRKAIEIAQANDVIVIAGKGHEDYQIIGQIKYPFDDRTIAASALLERQQGPDRGTRR